MRRRGTWWLALIVVTAVAGGCAEPGQPAASGVAVPTVDTEGMEPPVIRAIETARRAVLAAPGSAQAWGEYGIELDAHDLTAAAETCYGRAAELAPDDIRWPYLRAVALENAGAEHATVLTLYTTALALEPHFPPAHFRVGELLSRAGRLEEAATAYRAALAVDGELAVAHRGLAQTLLLLDRAEEAIEQLDHAERCEPGDRAVWAARAQCLAQLGRLDEARAAAERAGELEDRIALPDAIRYLVKQRCRSAEACRRRAGELVAAGDPAAAARELETVVEARPADVTALLMRGRCLAEAGRIDEAEEAWRAALSMDDGLVEAHLGLATIALRAGQRAAAIDHLEPVIRLEPQPGGARDARDRAAAGRPHGGGDRRLRDGRSARPARRPHRGQPRRRPGAGR